MRLLERIRNAIAAFSNRYEGAQPSSPDRSWIPAYYGDSRFDADSMSRQEMARKIRYFERNLWIVKRLREVHTKYTVGPNGLPVVPASSDPEWNARMADDYARWCESPGLDSLRSMSQEHRLMAGTHSTEGEAFFNLTYTKLTGQKAIPAIQFIEPHRVGNPGTYAEDKPNVIDGVEVNEDGRPVGYWIRDGLNGDSWAPRSAKQIIHVFDAERGGMPRGITPYHASLNTSHDLDDLEILEMGRAKENAHVANVLSTQSGEIPPGERRHNRYLGGSTPPTASEDDLSKRIENYRKVLGPRTIGLRLNEKLEQLANKNPSAATQWYWLYKIQQVCVAQNIPMMLVFPESIQGTVARAVLDDAHMSFRGQTAIYAPAAKRMYLHFAKWNRYNNPKLVDGPWDWFKCNVIPPRACNVDFGRNSAAVLAELYAGTTNWDEIAGGQGTTAFALMTKKADNVAMIKAIAKARDIEPSEICGPLADIILKLAEAAASESQAEIARIQSENPEKKELVEA